jgi:hypothetical protein
MKWFTRGLIVVLLGVGALGAPGCQQDNASEAEAAAKTAGDPGKPDPKGIPKAQEAPPASQEEFGKRQMQRQTDMYKKGGYPGNR